MFHVDISIAVWGDRFHQSGHPRSVVLGCDSCASYRGKYRSLRSLQRLRERIHRLAGKIRHQCPWFYENVKDSRLFSLRAVLLAKFLVTFAGNGKSTPNQTRVQYVEHWFQFRHAGIRHEKENSVRK